MTSAEFVRHATGETPFGPIPPGTQVRIDTPLVGLQQWGTIEGAPLAGYEPGTIVHAVQIDRATVFVLRAFLTDVTGIYSAAPCPRVRPDNYHLPPLWSC